jgi:hypothetical protein
MYRLLENIPASPETAGVRQEHPPNERPLKKGDRPGEPVEGTVEQTAGQK